MKTGNRRIVNTANRLKCKLSQSDEMARSRLNLIAFGCISGVVANLIGGTFFTGMLLYLNASNFQIGMVNILTNICNIVQLLSPLLLERFAHRKRILIALYVLTRVLNIVCIGLASLLPVAGQVRVYIILICIALINIANGIWNSGSKVWHIQSVPERERAGYFSILARLGGVIGYVILLAASAFSDYMKNTGSELGGYLILRAVAAVLCILEIFFLARVKEYPYPKGEPVRIRSIVTEPLRNKRYRATLLVAFLYSLFLNTNSSYYSVYLIQDVKLGYTFMNIVSTLYLPVVLLVMPVWTKLSKKHSWFNLTWKALLGFSIFFISNILVMPETKWVYPIVGIGSHVFNAGLSLIFANMIYYNIPRENQTVFVSFYSAITTLAALLGNIYATNFASFFEGHTFRVFGITAQLGQFMQMMTGVYLFCLSFFYFFVDRHEKKTYGSSAGAE